MHYTKISSEFEISLEVPSGKHPGNTAWTLSVELLSSAFLWLSLFGSLVAAILAAQG